MPASEQASDVVGSFNEKAGISTDVNIESIQSTRAYTQRKIELI